MPRLLAGLAVLPVLLYNSCRVALYTVMSGNPVRIQQHRDTMAIGVSSRIAIHGCNMMHSIKKD